MIHKERLFSKIKLSDYNKKLEEILVQKQFSEQAENLLLSMLYKIEDTYSDYKLVKKEKISKNEYIEEILKIIDDNCDEIELINPKTSKNSDKITVKRNENLIKIFPDELHLLYGLYKINEYPVDRIRDINFIDKALLKIINEGISINGTEIIRDFTGWSWVVNQDEIKNIKLNLFFQNLLLLFDRNFIIKNQKNKSILKTLENNLIELIGIEEFEKNKILLYQIIIGIYSNINSNTHKEVLLRMDQLNKKLEKIQDKESFMENIEIIKNKDKLRLDKINRILNDNRLLKLEFERENKKLSKNKKIFSLSEFVEILEFEKNDLKFKISENKYVTKKMLISRISNIKKTLKIYTGLKIEKGKHTDINKKIIEFQKIILKGILAKIKKYQNKRDLVGLVYNIRYYKYLPYGFNKEIGENSKIADLIEEIQMELSEKLLDNRIIDVVAENGNINYEIIKYIFDTKIMEIEKMLIKIQKQEDGISVEYYDGKILENKREIKILNVDNIRIKSNKKIKLFL